MFVGQFVKIYYKCKIYISNMNNVLIGINDYSENSAPFATTVTATAKTKILLALPPPPTATSPTLKGILCYIIFP